MKRDNKTKSTDSKASKKEMIKFLYKTKSIAKKEFSTPLDVRVNNYANNNKVTYTYGIR